MYLRYIEGVNSLVYDAKKCIGCRICTDVCPHQVLEMNDKKASLFDKDACIECGACAINCPVGAFTVRTGCGCATDVISKLMGNDDGCCGCGMPGEGADTDSY